tara:strand:+ start:1681 stop:2829 length:1149 start_codon:yes stop_codon:yes gene_type:complete
MMDTDVLVIGGGISGCALAYFLAKEGVEVSLVEQSGLNSQASGANAGSLHGQIPHNIFLEKGEKWALSFGPTLQLMRESLELWRDMEDLLGVDLEVRVSGGLLVASTEKEMRDVRSKVLIEKKFGVRAEILSRVDLRQHAPYISDKMVGAAFYPDEGKANPLLVTPAFAAQAEKCGATISRQVEVKNISVVRNGFEVDTTKGLIACKRIGNCAGVDAGRISAMVGLDIPIMGDPIQVNVTEPIAPLIEHLVYSARDKLTLKQTRHGSCIIGGGWSSRVDPDTGNLYVDQESVSKNLQVAIEMVPILRNVALVRTWPARVNGADDWQPILGEDPMVPGFFTNAFPWMGFSGGPVSSRVTADLMLGRSVNGIPGRLADSVHQNF